MEKNNYMKHFESELEIMKKNNLGSKGINDELIIEEFKKPIEEITKIFSSQGHSGSSNSFYTQVLIDNLKNILSFKPLSKITCSDEEWFNVEGETYQNKRDSAVFKKGVDGEPYYLDAIVWNCEEDGNSFTGEVEGIHSRQFIKLPFTPKTFYIDVFKQEVDKNEYSDGSYYENDGKCYVYRIKDETQLKEVSEYYNTEF